MDSIIGLLFVLVPVAFALIGKKLEKAGGHTPAEEEAPPMPEVFPPIQTLVPDDAPAQQEVPVVARKEAVRVLPPKPPKHLSKADKSKEDAKSEKKDPIDPKKLVIYSEIMKRKF